MSRSSWKGIFLQNSILEEKNKKIWSRSSTIPFFLINTRAHVHNGKIFKKIFITRAKVGYKFGAFSFTRQFTRKIKKKLLKKKKNGPKK